MTTRNLVRAYMAGKGTVSVSEIQDYLKSVGVSRSSADNSLSVMTAAGEVIRTGKYKHATYKLNANYTPSPRSVYAPNPCLSKEHALQRKTVMCKASLSTNNIFDAYRQCSPVYLMDTLLREVRNAATS